MDVLVRIGMPVLVKSINWEVQYEKVPVDLDCTSTACRVGRYTQYTTSRIDNLV